MHAVTRMVLNMCRERKNETDKGSDENLKVKI